MKFRPARSNQSTPAATSKALGWIEKEISKLDPASPDPGRITIRRRNRTEYQNAAHHLLGMEYDIREIFPPDDSGYGSDNIGSVLFMSPPLMEKYLTAADEVVAPALPDGVVAQVPRVDIAERNSKDSGDPKTTGDWLPFAKARKVRLDREIQQDGDYQIDAGYPIHSATEATTNEVRKEVSAGGKKVGEAILSWDQRRVNRLTGKAAFQKGRQDFRIEIASPRFLFRTEIQPEPNNTAKIVPLDEYPLASRLSFFLWGSVPHDKLFSLAYQTKPRQNLSEQVDQRARPVPHPGARQTHRRGG